MSVERLAEIVGADPTRISRYEAGDARIEAEHLLRIARAFDENISVFFEAAESEAATSERDAPQSDEEYELIRAFANVHDPVLRRNIIDLAKYLAAAQEAAADS